MSSFVLLSMSLELPARALARWRKDELDEALDPRWPGDPGEPIVESVADALEQAREAGLRVDVEGSCARIAGRIEQAQWPIVGAGVLAAIQRGRAHEGQTEGVIAWMPEGELSVVTVSGDALELRDAREDERDALWARLAPSVEPTPTSPSARRSVSPARGARELARFGATVTALALGADGRVWLAAGDEVHWSDDEGERWTKTERGPGGYPRAFHEDGRGLFVAGFRLPLTRSEDRGASFQRVDAPRMGERNGIVPIPAGLLAYGDAPSAVVRLAEGAASAVAWPTPARFSANAHVMWGEELLVLGNEGAVLRARGAALEPIESSTKLDLLAATLDARGRIWAVTSRSLVRAPANAAALAWKTVRAPKSPWSVAASGDRLFLGAGDGLYELGSDDVTWEPLWTSDDVVRRMLVLPNGRVIASTQAGRVLEIAR